MKEKFIDRRFNERDSLLIEACNHILDRYRVLGYDLSLRQLYYQLVSRNVIANTVHQYKVLGSLINDARMAGLIDWAMIVDRGRVTYTPTVWSGLGPMLASAVKQFRINRWKNQQVYIEVMAEKQAVEGILIPVCSRYGVRFTANKGYSSASSFYHASKRILQAIKRKKEPVVLYVGDHDPSGVDMTRDLKDRMATLCRIPVDVKRLALNRSQIDEHKLPPNPAKLTDSRADDYVSKHGDESWELDALPPTTLAHLVISAIKRRIDWPAWKVDGERERSCVTKLAALAHVIDTVDLRILLNVNPAALPIVPDEPDEVDPPSLDQPVDETPE